MGAGVDVRPATGRLGHTDLQSHRASIATRSRSETQRPLPSGVGSSTRASAGRSLQQPREGPHVPKPAAHRGATERWVAGHGSSMCTRRRGRPPLTIWVEELTEAKFVALDAALRLVIARRGIELARTEWLKPLGDGLHEFHPRHDEGEMRRMFGDAENHGRRGERILLRVFADGGCRDVSSTFGGHLVGSASQRLGKPGQVCGTLCSAGSKVPVGSPECRLTLLTGAAL